MTGKHLITRYHQAVNARDFHAFDSIFASDFVNIAAGFSSINSREELKNVIRELIQAFPDFHVTADDVVEEGNKVATRWTVRATHLKPYKDIPAHSKKIVVEGIHIDLIAGELIQKRWSCNNYSEVFANLRLKS